jgi:hypothetical protein
VLEEMPMMIVYSGNVRVFHLMRRSEVFVPASEDEASRFHAAFDRDLFDPKRPRCLRPTIDILDEAFSRVAAACRRAGIAAPVARIGIALDDYDDEPDAIVDEICRQTSACDLKLDFRDRVALAHFLREYEAVQRSEQAPSVSG